LTVHLLFIAKKTGGYNIYMNSGRFCLPRSGFVQQWVQADRKQRGPIRGIPFHQQIDVKPISLQLLFFVFFLPFYFNVSLLL